MPHSKDIENYRKSLRRSKDKWIDWKVRPAELEDVLEIAKLSIPVKYVVPPYGLDANLISKYIDQWVVVEDPKTVELGGAEHSVSNTYIDDKALAYLRNLQQIDEEVLTDFFENSEGVKRVLKSQIACPGKGSMKALVDYQKENFDEVWIWFSLNSPVRDFCIREGFEVEGQKVYTFMNIWKGNYSNFVVGKWKKKPSIYKNLDQIILDSRSLAELTGRAVRWNLEPIDSTPEGSNKRLEVFFSEMKNKWDKGAKEHGPKFKTDPFEEAMNECLDLALYAKVIYFRIQALQSRLGKEGVINARKSTPYKSTK